MQVVVINNSVNNFDIQGETKRAEGGEEHNDVQIKVQWMLNRAVKSPYNITPFDLLQKAFAIVINDRFNRKT